MDDSGTLTLVCYAPKGVTLSFKAWLAESGIDEAVIMTCDDASKLIAPEVGALYKGHAVACLSANGTAEFAATDLAVDENSNVIVRVCGGNPLRTASVKVYLAYTDASSSDLDLAKTLVNGKAVSKSFKFPVTLTWAAGEVGEKTITLKAKKDSLAEGPEAFTLQLGDELGMTLGEAHTATVTIGDAGTTSLKPSAKNPSKTKGVKQCEVAVRSADEEAGIAVGSGTYYEGTKLTVKAQAKTGAAFAGWYDLATGKKLSTSANYTFTVSKARTLEARFSVRYNVRALADPADGATVSGSGWYAKNKTAKLKVTVKSHFKFLGWYAAKADDPNAPDMTKKLSSKTTYTTGKITKDMTVFACCKSDPRLEIFKTSGGSVKGAAKYAKGKTATLKATVSKGYAFLGWFDAEGNLVSQATTYKYKMGADSVAFTAQFKKESALAAPVLDWNAATEFPVGVGYSAKPTVSGEAAVKVVSVTGLPAGLSYKSGKVSGAPTAVKTYTAKVKVALATNSKKTWTLTQKLVVTALPAWTKGTFNGGSETTPMQATLTIGSTGKASGKLSFANAVWTLSGTKISKLDSEAKTATLSLTAKKGSAKKTVAVTLGEDELGGFAFSETKGFEFEARQGLWTSDALWKSCAAALVGAAYADPKGDLTVTFGANGKATAKLKSGRNTFSASAVLCPTEIGETAVTGKLYLYFAPNTKKKFKGAVRVVDYVFEQNVEP